MTWNTKVSPVSNAQVFLGIIPDGKRALPAITVEPTDAPKTVSLPDGEYKFNEMVTPQHVDGQASLAPSRYSQMVGLVGSVPPTLTLPNVEVTHE